MYFMFLLELHKLTTVELTVKPNQKREHKYVRVVFIYSCLVYIIIVFAVD